MGQNITHSESELYKFEEILEKNGIDYNQINLDEKTILLQAIFGDNSRVFRLTVFLDNPGSFFIEGWDKYTSTVQNAVTAFQSFTGITLNTEINEKEDSNNILDEIERNPKYR